jgi:hypothetical protein
MSDRTEALLTQLVELQHRLIAMAVVFTAVLVPYVFEWSQYLTSRP